MSLLEKVLQECNHEPAALVIVCSLRKVIHAVDTLSSGISYMQQLNIGNKLFLFKGKFGNCP